MEKLIKKKTKLKSLPLRKSNIQVHNWKKKTASNSCVMGQFELAGENWRF